jgi:hypothetical protein
VAADGVADPRRYAEMAAEDRALQLAGYEVYRFGAHELTTVRPEHVGVSQTILNAMLTGPSLHGGLPQP